MADYGGAPLARKLGIQPGHRIRVVAPPEGFAELLEPLPADVRTADSGDPIDVAVVFAVCRRDLEKRFQRAMQRIPSGGAIWVAWPKRSSGVETDVDGNVLREMFLPTGMVDNKVAAVDETWTAMRFVVRKEHRATWR